MVFPSDFFNTEKWKLLSKSARAVLLCVSTYADKSGLLYPSINKIADTMKMNRHTVIDSIRELADNGIMCKEINPGKVTRYRISLSSEPVPIEAPVPKRVLTSAPISTTPVPKGALEHTKNRDNTHIKSNCEILELFPKKDDDKTMLTNKNANLNKLVDEVYLMYPTKDPNNLGRSTGKSTKNKDRIRKIIQSGYPLEKAIEFYLNECKQSGRYLKNFGTFLNNLPDEKEITLKPEEKVVDAEADNLRKELVAV